MPYRYLAPPPLNPFARIVAGLVAAAALLLAFVFGLFILAVAVGLGLLAWLLLALRVWWLRRRQRAGQDGDVTPERQAAWDAGGESDAIEGEYEVVSRREDD